jgi:hypothetical protein
MFSLQIQLYCCMMTAEYDFGTLEQLFIGGRIISLNPFSWLFFFCNHTDKATVDHALIFSTQHLWDT